MTEDVAASVREAVQATIKETGFTEEGARDAREAPTPTPEEGKTRGADGKFLAAEEKPVEKPVEEKLVEEKPTEEKLVEEKPAEEKKAAPVEDEGGLRPTAEELAIIDQSPELKKVYRSMVRGLTAKTTEAANTRKEAETALDAIKAIKENPQVAIRALAAAAGIKLVDEPKGAEVPAEKNAVDRLRERLEPKIGKEAADVLAPVILDAVGSITGEEIAPIKEALAQQDKVAQQRNLSTAISEFGSKVVEDGGDWDEDVEKEMAGLVGKILPGKDVSLPDFLQVLHNNVQVNRSKLQTKEREVTRIQKAAKTAEPVRATRAAAPTPEEITPGMDIKKATALAIQSARAEAASR